MRSKVFRKEVSLKSLKPKWTPEVALIFSENISSCVVQTHSTSEDSNNTHECLDTTSSLNISTKANKIFISKYMNGILDTYFPRMTTVPNSFSQ